MYGIKFDQLLGRPLKSVAIVKDDTVRFEFLEGEPFEIGCEGDCCSHSWMEKVTAPDVTGAVVSSVREAKLEPWDNHVCSDEVDYTRGCGHDSLEVYHVIFETDRGEIVLEYRNDSNGYYGGYLVNYP